MSANSRATGSARASVTVEDHDRQPAAQAAIALRRAGLRPALERTFHWGEETHGLVVAQEPPAGSEVPLDSTVLLFVSAPGERDDETERPAAAPLAPKLEGPTQPAGVTGGTDQTPGATQEEARRRRKRRPSPTPHDVDVRAGEGGRAGVESPPSAPFEQPDHDDGLAAQCETVAHDDSEEDLLLSLAQATLACASARRAYSGRLRDRATAPYRGVPSSALLLAAAAFVVTLLLVLVLGHAHALQAAGAFNGTPISGVQTFVDKLRGNLVWLGGTAMGLVIAVVGIMFMAGHSRAHDLAIRTLVGLAILASISGIVA
jgi:hypothetical protein